MDAQPPSIRSVIQQWAQDGVGVMIAILFWIIVAVIVVVATASSKSPWDTVIAALAMTSQAFFAWMVWRLGKAQYAFTRQVADRQNDLTEQIADRQHKIDMFPLRKAAAERLDAAVQVLLPIRAVSEDDVEEIRLCHLDINKVFPDQTDDLAFNLYQLMEEALRLQHKTEAVYNQVGEISVPADAGMTDDAYACLDDAFNVLVSLQIEMDDEMRIR